MFARPGLCGIGIGRLGLVAASRPGLVAQALAILAKYGAAANLYLPGVGAISGITAGNWLDSAGTTPATVDNPVGLAVSSGKAVGPELVTNGTFDTPTGWTLRQQSFDVPPIPPAGISGGALNMLAAGGQNYVAYTGQDLLAGKSYEVLFDVVSSSTGAGGVQVGTFNPATSGWQSQGTYFGTAGRQRLVLSCTYTGRFAFWRYSAHAGDVVVDNVTVRELPGAHLTQSTAANRPVLRRGLVNQLLWSGAFSNAAWTASKSAGATIGALTTGPDGQQSARLVTFASSSDYLYQGFLNYPAVTGQSVTVAFVCNTATRAFSFGGGTTEGTDVFAAYDMGGGFWLQMLTRTFTATTSAITLQVLPGLVAGTFAYHRAALYQGTVTASQILASGGIPLTTTAPASSATGPFAWQFDGSNDSFNSALITGNEGWFCAGVAFDSAQDAYSAVLYAGEVDVSKKSVYLFRGTQGFNARRIALAISDGTNRYILNSPAQVANGAPNVVDCGWSSVQRFISVNGSVTSESSANTYGPSAGAAQIGTYFGTNNLNGRLFPIFFAPTVLPTASERATLRQFIASLSGVTL